MMPMNSPKMAGTTTTAQFFSAWRIVAWARVRPLVRASSMNSLVSTSVSSARVVLVKPAITVKDSDSTAGSMLTNMPQLSQSVPAFIRKGNQPSLKLSTYWIINAYTKLGTEMTIIVRVETV